MVDKAQYDRIMGIISNAQKDKEGTLLSGGDPIGSKVSFTCGNVLSMSSSDDNRAIISIPPYSRIPQKAPQSTKTRFSGL